MQPFVGSSINSRTYTKAELNTFMMASMQQMFRLYQFSNQRNIELKQRLNAALKIGQVSQVGQLGGANVSYTKAEFNSLLQNSLQQLLMLYQQSQYKNTQLKQKIKSLGIKI